MNKKSIAQSRTQKQAQPLRPSEVYPDLVPHLAEISKKSYELYELTKPEIIGKKLGISRQAFQQRIDKLKEGSK